MTNKQIKVLLLEDEAAHAEAIRRALESPENTFELQEAGSLEKYREQVEANPPDIALLDMMLPDGNSIDLLTAPPEANAFPMIILTSHGNEQAAVAALKAGALDYVVKSPETIADMRRIITRNLNQWSLIQEKSKAEQALRESEINFRNSIENSPLGIRIIGEDGETLYTNRAFLDICGYQNFEEFQNTPVEQRYTPGSYTELKERQEKRRRREMLTDNFEVSIIRKDGSIRQLQVMRREILWGGQRRYHSIYQDVTERKHMTQQILELNNILHLISEVNQLIVHADNEVELLQKACSRIVENRRYQIAWIGFKQEGSYDILPSAQCGERIDYLSSAKITWDDSPFGCGPTGAAIKTGKPMVIKDISHHPSYKPWREKALESGLKSSAAFPLCIQDKVIGVLHVYSEAVDAFDEEEISLLSEMAEDMSLGIEKIRQREELLQMDEALKESEAFNRSLFENAPNPILVADGETAISYVNPALETLTGYKSAELIGKKIPYPWWQPEEGGRHDRSDQTPDLINLDINARKKDGELFWYFAKLNRVFENGKVKYFISNWVDVTERRKAEESLRESESKSRAQYRAIPIPTYTLRKVPDDFELVDYNDAAFETTQGKIADSINVKSSQFWHDRPDICDHILRCYNLQSIEKWESEYVARSTGKNKIVSFTVIFVKPEMVTLYADDVTELRKNEQQLREAFSKQTERQGEISALLEASRAVNEEKTFSSLARSIFGISKRFTQAATGYIALIEKDNASNELIFLDSGEYSQAFVPSLSKPIQGLALEVYQSGKTAYDNRFAQSDDVKSMPAGHAAINNVLFAPIVVEGKAVGMLTLANKPGGFSDRDARTATALAEFAGLAWRDNRRSEALTQSEELYRSLFNNILNGFAYCQMIYERNRPLDFIYLAVNKAFETQTGLKNVVGKKVSEVIPGILESDPGLFEIYGRVAATGASEHFEIYVAAMREWFSVSVYGTGKERFVAVFDAITQRKKAEESLRASEEKYRSLINNIKLGIFRSNPAGRGRFLEVNKAMEYITGYSRHELLEMDVADIYTDSEARRNDVDNVILSRNEVPLETNFKKKDGTIITVSGIRKAIRDDSGSVISIDGILEDITERRKMEASRDELERKSQIANRLTAMGEMVAGIAHEINNPITGVLGFSQLLLEEPNLPEELRDDLKVIAGGSQRVADIVKRLLTFSRQTKPIKTSVNLNQLIDNTIKLRTYVLQTANIEAVTQFDRELPLTLVDAGQMQQVFLNLIVNAEQAMKEAHGKGTLVIATRRKADKIMISFQDDGPGIEKNIMTRIFEPFFTTKQPGEGTGLGLSLSRSMVLEQGGEIKVESEPGHGATFIVELPIIQVLTQAEEAPASAVNIKTQTNKPARVLVVDDEPGVRQLIERVLMRVGHSVDTLDDPTMVLDHLDRNSYDVIFLDVRMPGISGIELYGHILEKAPGFAGKIIFITGDAMGSDIKAFLKDNNLPYLAKPFKVEELKEKVDAIWTNI